MKKIEFPEHGEQDVVKDPNNPGCYMLKGVRVLDQSVAENKLYMHVQMAQGVDSTGVAKEMEECYDYDPDTQCDGYGGDW